MKNNTLAFLDSKSLRCFHGNRVGDVGKSKFTNSVHKWLYFALNVCVLDTNINIFLGKAVTFLSQSSSITCSISLYLINHPLLLQITVGRKPVTGLRLNLEGCKQNRLAIHLQHLVSLPKILQPHWDSHVAIGAPKWHGPEEQDSRWFEPIKWKNFSHVSTAPIEYTEANIGDLSGVHIVTGAQLGVWDFGAKNVLYLKLLFSKVPGCTIRRSVWDHSPSIPATPLRSDGASSSSKTRTSEDKKEDSSSNAGKLAKIVDLTEMSKGPQDIPGHWLVTGAKLGVDKGRIVLRIKYSLLNY